MTEPVPNEYETSVQKGSEQISNGADLVMFVAEMLGNDTFELDTPMYHIIIKKRSDNVGESGKN
jgi:hypothetical protein